jgi:hypothetical protein
MELKEACAVVRKAGAPAMNATLPIALDGTAGRQISNDLLVVFKAVVVAHSTRLQP